MTDLKARVVAGLDEFAALTVVPAFKGPEVVLEILEEDFDSRPRWDCLGELSGCTLTAMWTGEPPGGESGLEARCLLDGSPKLELVSKVCGGSTPGSQGVQKTLKSA